MSKASIAIKNLRRIRGLWQSIERKRADTPSYRKIVNEISVLSKQYQKLVQGMHKSKKSK